jgi:hypothetical protein
MHVPAGAADGRRRQQRRLHLPGQVEISLQRRLLVGFQVAQAVADHRLGTQLVVIETIAAHGTPAECVGAEALEGSVDLAEQSREVLGPARLGHGRGQPLPSIEQLTVERCGHGGIHRWGLPGWLA